MIKYLQEQGYRVKIDDEEEVFGTLLPKPNLIINLGRGLHLVWLITPVPYKVLPLWSVVQDYFYKQLKDLRVDRKS